MKNEQVNDDSNALENLKQLMSMLLRHLFLIISSVIVTTIIAVVVTLFFMNPKYQSTTEILVNQKGLSKQVGELQQAQTTDVQLVNTYKNIITSPTIQNQALARMDNDPMAKNSKVAINTQPNSQVFSVDVTAGSPRVASMYANQLTSVFAKRVKKIMNINNVTVLSSATPKYKPVFPKTKLNIAAGILIGLILGSMLALLKEYNQKTVENADFITDQLGLTNLGTIDDLKDNQAKKNNHHHHDEH